MDINVTLIGLFITGLFGIIWGFRKGFAKAVSNFIASVSTIFMLGIFLRIYYSYSKGQTMDFVISIVVLVAFGAIYGILRILIKSVKAIANLPIIAGIDKILGMILGAALVIVIYHLVAKASSMGFLGKYGNYIISDINNDEWLAWLLKYDLLEMFTIWKNGLLDNLK